MPSGLLFSALLAAPAGGVGFNDVLPDARAMGMGHAFAAVADDAYGMFYNPAGTANAPYVQSGGSLGRILSPVGTLTMASGTYLRPYEPINTAVVGAAYSMVRQSDGGDMDTVLFNFAQEIKVARLPLSRPLKVGGNFKFVNVDKGRAKGGKFGLGLDAGVLARTDMGLTAGAALTELTSDVGVPRGGFVLAAAYAWRKRLLLAGDFRVKGGLAEFYPGIEATLLQGLLRLRAGKGLVLDGVRTLAFGLGVNFSPVILDVAMSLPTAGLNRPGGGYQASLQYRFGAPSFAAQYMGRSTDEAESLRVEIDRLEDRRKTLDLEARAAETNKASAEAQLRSLGQRSREAQDLYRALLKRNEEIDYRVAEKAAGLRPSVKPIALPKPKPKAVPPPWPKSHRVEAGDTLRSIAGRYYGDPNLWERIYEANREKVQRGLPDEGAILVVPSPKP